MIDLRCASGTGFLQVSYPAGFLADDHELVYELDVVVDGPETGPTPTHPWRGTWVTPLTSSRSSHTCFINTHPQHKYSIKHPPPMMRKDVPQWFSAGNLRIRSNSQGIPEEGFEGLGYLASRDPTAAR